MPDRTEAYSNVINHDDAIYFFFQAEDGIRDHCVTGVQTCALPIYSGVRFYFVEHPPFFDREALYGTSAGDYPDNAERFARSEERRVGKECRCRWVMDSYKKKA